MPIRKITLLALLISHPVLFSQKIDTLFFESLKRFYNQRCGHNLNKKLFTEWAKSNSEPFCYVFVSKLKKVENTLGEHDYIYAGQDTLRARLQANSYIKKGFSAFHYKSFGTSDTKITKNLLEYSVESKAFIVFHELTHNYFIEKKTEIAYEVNEAACDVIAVNFSRLLLKERVFIHKKEFQRAVKSLEGIYEIVNKTILKIEQDSLNYFKYCSNAENKIKRLTKNTDVFFQNRFVYPVNTAYLLKNQNYCKHYSLVSKLYLKSKSFEEFVNELITLSKRI